MKVLHVLNHSVPHTDGYCIRSANIVRCQRELGMEPVVLTSPHQEPRPTEAAQTIDGIKYYRVFPAWDKRFLYFHEAYAVRRLASRIAEVAGQERPDVIHAHSPCLWGMAAVRAARRSRIPVVYEIRGLWEGETDDRRLPLKYRIGRWLETRVARGAHAVTTISQPLSDDLLSRGIRSDKVFVVPNGVDLDRFVPSPRDQELASRLGLNGGLCLGYLGSLYPFEGVDDLLFAMKSVVPRSPTTKLLVIGSGNQAEAIQRLIGQLDLQGHVNFVGRVPHDQVARYYSVIDVLVYPRKRSRTTDLVTPLKPLEAMAMGKPILASDVGGLRALLGPHGAAYFRAGNREHLADMCLELIASAGLRHDLASQARQHVVQSHEWSRLIERYREIYQFALGAHSAGNGHRPAGLPMIEESSRT